MSLTEKLQAGPPAYRMPKCKIALVFEHFMQLDKPEEAKALRSMLDDRDEYGTHTWKGSKVAENLREEGFPVSDQAVNRHRRGICQCGTDQ